MPSPWDKPEGKEWETYHGVVTSTTRRMRLGAPTVFGWIEWCVILAAIRYAQIKTGEWALLAIQVLLAVLLWGYFMQFFTTSEVKWLPKEKLFSRGSIASWVISLGATAGMIAASFWLAGVFIEYPL